MRLQMLVPLHTYPEGNAERIAVHVAAFARHLEADVHALVLAAEFPGISSALGNLLIDMHAMVSDAKAKCRTRGGALVRALEAELGATGVALRSGEVECLPTTFGDVVADRGRYHDMILVGLGSDDSTLQNTAAAAIFGSGRPTVLVSEAASPSSPEHVMIAWDGSRVAARAVADAGEFLRRAKTVTIATVVGEKPLPDHPVAERLADYLGLHGINAEVAQVRNAGRPIAETLQQHARDVGAGLLVMGGFGHSRMRDFVFGGATSGILKNLQVPALLSN